MKPRERAIKAINHEEPDRVPLEGIFWGEWAYPFLLKLFDHFGVKDEDAVARKLDIDFRAVSVEPPDSFKEKAVCDRYFHNPWGIRVGPDTIEDEWGVRRQLNATRTQSRVVHHSLKGKESLDGYEFPDPFAEGRFETAEELVKKWRDTYAVAGGWGIDSFFCQGWYMRGFRELVLDMYERPKFVEELFDRLLEFYVETGKAIIDTGLDVFCIADDVAGQTGMIVSPLLWRKYVKPRMREMLRAFKKRDVYISYHTDGDFEPIIPDLIEIGVDIINPVQPECMDPAEIKKKYGDRLTLSGTISVQETLPFGTIEDVRREVITRIRTCGHHGGLIIAPSNQALVDAKVENFLAIYETAKKYGRYPLS